MKNIHRINEKEIIPKVNPQYGLAVDDETGAYLKPGEGVGFDADGNVVITNTVISVLYADLVEARSSGRLKPGFLYRITDYVTTTAQVDTASAGHPFDVIVLALNENALSEQAWAALHEGDNYFASSKLHAWKLWYSLDNDTTRFAWADTVNGKGVIYRMIDEWNNDVFYDFKNILTISQQVDGNFVTSDSSRNYGRCLDNLIDLYNNAADNELLRYSARPSLVSDGVMNSSMYCASSYISVGVLEDKKLYYTFSSSAESDFDLNGQTLKIKGDLSLTGRVFSNTFKNEYSGAWTLPRLRCLMTGASNYIAHTIISGYYYWDISICTSANVLMNRLEDCHHLFICGYFANNLLRYTDHLFVGRMQSSDIIDSQNLYIKPSDRYCQALLLRTVLHLALGKEVYQITARGVNNYVTIGDNCASITLEENSSEAWLGDYNSTVHVGMNVDHFRIYSDTTKQRPINYMEGVTVENAIFDGTYPTFVYSDEGLSEENKLRGIMIDGAAYNMADLSSITPGNNYTTKVSKGVNGEVIIWREADTVQKIGDINTVLENIING